MIQKHKRASFQIMTMKPNERLILESGSLRVPLLRESLSLCDI